MAPLLALVPLQGPAPVWKTYVSAQDRFTVDLPGKPIVQTMTRTDEGLTATIRSYLLKTELTNVAISVVILNTTSPQIAHRVAKAVVPGFLRSAGGTADAGRPATYGSLTGTETHFRERTGHSGSIWTVERPGKVYSLTILGVKAPPTAEAKRVFSSFKPS